MHSKDTCQCHGNLRKYKWYVHEAYERHTNCVDNSRYIAPIHCAYKYNVTYTNSSINAMEDVKIYKAYLIQVHMQRLG